MSVHKIKTAAEHTTTGPAVAAPIPRTGSRLAAPGHRHHWRSARRGHTTTKGGHRRTTYTGSGYHDDDEAVRNRFTRWWTALTSDDDGVPTQYGRWRRRRLRGSAATNGRDRQTTTHVAQNGTARRPDASISPKRPHASLEPRRSFWLHPNVNSRNSHELGWKPDTRNKTVYGTGFKQKLLFMIVLKLNGQHITSLSPTWPQCLRIDNELLQNFTAQCNTCNVSTCLLRWTRAKVSVL